MVLGGNAQAANCQKHVHDKQNLWYACHMEKTDLHWLAGLLEGEGYFALEHNTPKIGLQMTDEDVVKKAAKLLWNAHVYTYKRNNFGFKRVYGITVRGKKLLPLFTQLLPLMGERRAEKIKEIINQYDPHLSRKARIKRRALTEQQELEVYEKYNSGKVTFNQLGEEYGVNARTVSRATRRVRERQMNADNP